MTRVPAGSYADWLRMMRTVIAQGASSDVPCGDCVACCTSQQFIHIEPDESAVLAAIPEAVRFAAPHLPQGHYVMGYDERGHCPMFRDGACSIYEVRPRTCRMYDCRIFAATDVPVDDASRAAINARVQDWEFTFADASDAALHESVLAARDYLLRHAEVLHSAGFRSHAQGLAVASILAATCFQGPALSEADLRDAVIARLTT